MLIFVSLVILISMMYSTSISHKLQAMIIGIIPMMLRLISVAIPIVIATAMVVTMMTLIPMQYQILMATIIPIQ